MSGYIPIYAEGVTDSNGSPAGKVVAEGLAKNGALVLAGATYNASTIKGFMIIADGSADWSLTFYGTDGTDGGTVAFTPPAGSEGQIIPVQLTSITVGTAGEAVVFI